MPWRCRRREEGPQKPQNADREKSARRRFLLRLRRALSDRFQSAVRGILPEIVCRRDCVTLAHIFHASKPTATHPAHVADVGERPLATLAPPLLHQPLLMPGEGESFNGMLWLDFRCRAARNTATQHASISQASGARQLSTMQENRSSPSRPNWDRPGRTTCVGQEEHDGQARDAEGKALHA